MQCQSSYVIEVEDEAVGLVVRDGAGMVFHAAHPKVSALHGQLFPDARDAVRAAQHALRLAA